VTARAGARGVTRFCSPNQGGRHGDKERGFPKGEVCRDVKPLP